MLSLNTWSQFRVKTKLPIKQRTFQKNVTGTADQKAHFPVRRTYSKSAGHASYTHEKFLILGEAQQSRNSHQLYNHQQQQEAGTSVFSCKLHTRNLLALPWACVPPAWRYERVGLQIVESTPELGMPQSQAILVWATPTPINGNHRWGTFKKMSKAGLSHLPSASSYPHISLGISKYQLSLTKMMYNRRNPYLTFPLLYISGISPGGIIWPCYQYLSTLINHKKQSKVTSSTIHDNHAKLIRFLIEVCHILSLYFQYPILILCQFYTGTTSLTPVELILICSSRQSE